MERERERWRWSGAALQSLFVDRAENNIRGL